MKNFIANKDLLRSVDTYLTIIGEPFKIENSRPYVVAKCKCGVIKLYLLRDISNGSIKSCGCYLKEVAGKQSIKHHGSNTPLYNTWCGMKGRCNNKNSPSYGRYGAKGIDICREWDSDFALFKDWAVKNGWEHGLQVDRIDNDKGYSPDNCRVVTSKANARNRGSNIKITHNGETKILVEWVEFYGLNYSRTLQRYYKGLVGDDLFATEKIPNNVSGWKHTDEAKRKISEAHIGKKRQAHINTIEAARRTHTGRKWSDEQRKNHRDAVIAYHQKKKGVSA